ncbi:MAG: nitroreductase [Clostridiales bacterium]|nr:nitroreductase [Clostridiales bacterium]
MTVMEVINARHAVRSYTDTPLPAEVVKELSALVDECNREGKVNIQLITGEPKAFDSLMARFGKFSGVANYLAMVGEKSADGDTRLGYYGEKITLTAQQLGLNSCWVGSCFSRGKSPAQVAKGEKFACAVALGYGTTQGVPHKSKEMDALCQVEGEKPDWFVKGMEAAMLAPTAMNQQKFLITLSGKDTVSAKSTGGMYSDIDLGIVKYHFEVGAGKGNFRWA